MPAACGHPGRRRWLGRVAVLAAGAVAGCAWAPDEDHHGPDAPRALPLPGPARTAWVFSSGGPRGFVHIGVVKALDELGLVPDLIVGASAGAVVAVLRAAGVGGLALEALALDLQPWRLARVAVGSEWRLSGAALADFVRERIDGRPLEQLPVRVGCVAHRPQRGDVVAFTAGDPGLAVQASSAIEGRMAPVRIRGELHVDADLHLPLPVRLARSLGAVRVLAVDASAHEDRAPPGTEAWRDGDLRKRALTRPDAMAADLLLHPDTGYYAGLSVAYRRHCIDVGYRDTLAFGPQLRRLHAA